MVYYVDFLTTPDIKLVADNYKRIGLGLSNGSGEPRVVKSPTFKSGGWLDKYQNGNEVKTYANDPSYFDNRFCY